MNKTKYYQVRTPKSYYIKINKEFFVFKHNKIT